VIVGGGGGGEGGGGLKMGPNEPGELVQRLSLFQDLSSSSGSRRQGGSMQQEREEEDILEAWRRARARRDPLVELNGKAPLDALSSSRMSVLEEAGYTRPEPPWVSSSSGRSEFCSASQCGGSLGGKLPAPEDSAVETFELAKQEPLNFGAAPLDDPHGYSKGCRVLGSDRDEAAEPVGTEEADPFTSSDGDTVAATAAAAPSVYDNREDTSGDVEPSMSLSTIEHESSVSLPVSASQVGRDLDISGASEAAEENGNGGEKIEDPREIEEGEEETETATPAGPRSQPTTPVWGLLLEVPVPGLLVEGCA